jgi:ABC-type antimicrobial peptide transport system permease subunit
MQMVLGDGMRLVALGLVLGVGAALALSRLVTALLYGTSAVDVGTYVAIAVALGAVALGAIVVPARRAMRIDPMTALKTE